MRAGASFVLLLLAAGCGGEVEIDLVQAGFDNPYRGLDRLYVSVLDPQGAVLSQRKFDPFGADLRMPGLEPGSGRVVVIEGRAGTELRARGESGPLTLAGGETRRVPVPFASMAVAVALPVSAIAAGARVDGRLDEWASAPVAAMLGPKNAVIGQPPNDAALSARVYLAWAPDGLYVAIRVLDNCVLCAPSFPDKAIVSWDGRGDSEPDFYGPDDGNATVGPSLIEIPADVAAAAMRLPGGYGVELRIGYHALGIAAPVGAARLGLEIELFDGRSSGYEVVEAWVLSPDPLVRRPWPAEMGSLGIETWP